MQTETTQTDFDFDWAVEDPIDDPKDYWKWYNLQNCGKAKWSTDPKTGEAVVEYFRRCNQAECPKCQARKRKAEAARLDRIDKSKSKFCQVDSEDEAKKLMRKYGKDKVRRMPLPDGKTGLWIETNDTLPNEQEFTDEIAEKWIDNAVSSDDSRRPSGSLGKAPSQLPKKEEEPQEETPSEKYDWDVEEKVDYTIQVKVKEYTSDFDSDNPDAPKNIQELYKMMHREVEIDANPTDHREVWAGINAMQDKLEEIMTRYTVSFRCIKTLLKEVNLYDIDWKFVKNRR